MPQTSSAISRLGISLLPLMASPLPVCRAWRALNTTAFVCVSDMSQGYIALANTPRTRRVKTIFLAMRHAIDDMEARLSCMETLREVFRQFMSKLILERTKLEQNCIFLDERITFNEMNEYFFSGCACAYFQIAVDTFTDLRWNADEWE